jgi:2-methylcitrate dehydratase
MTIVQDMARFVAGAAFEDLSPAACGELKIRILDALGCASGALEGEPIRMLQAQLDDFGGRGVGTDRDVQRIRKENPCLKP